MVVDSLDCHRARYPSGDLPVTNALYSLYSVVSDVLALPRRGIRGVLSMLDEECLLPHGTDNGFVALLECQTQVRIASGCKGCTRTYCFVFSKVYKNNTWYNTRYNICLGTVCTVELRHKPVGFTN